VLYTAVGYKILSNTASPAAVVLPASVASWKDIFPVAHYRFLAPGCE